MNIQALGNQNNYLQHNESLDKRAYGNLNASQNNQQDDSKLTLSTDDVDEEIEDLKVRRIQISKSIDNLNDDIKIKDLQQKLKQVDDELRLKDNDEYRRQHAKVIAGLDLKI